MKNDRLVYNLDKIRPKVLEAVDLITAPVAATMGPEGSNVIFTNQAGFVDHSNDGITIGKNIDSPDPVISAILDIIKTGSFKTNLEAGDGTSSTILLSSVLIKGGLKLVDMGYSRKEINEELNRFSDFFVDQIESRAIKIKKDSDLFNIAKISSNNDVDIAKDIVEVVSFVGEEGGVMINDYYGSETKIIKETGYIVQSSIYPELVTGSGFAAYEDPVVFITDKRIYYPQEAETIITTALENGYKNIVVVASDFIGEALPYFISNHKQGIANIMLIKETNLERLSDIADYLNSEVVSDKTGKIVNKIEIGNFVMAQRVYQDGGKAIITRYVKEKNKKLDNKITFLKSELERIGDKESLEYNEIKSRISSLTRGMATIRVAGRTQLEIRDKMYRYEDAINATRGALKDGYVVGGGLSIYHAGMKYKTKDKNFSNLFKEVCSANIKQVAENSGFNGEICLSEIIKISSEFGDNWGYNAKTGAFEDLIKSGIVEPVNVLKNVIKNAVSIARVIIGSEYLIVNNNKNETKKENQ